MLPIVRTGHRTLTMKELAPSHFPGKAEDLIKPGRKTYHSDLAVSEPDHVCTAAATHPPERQPCQPC
jgi:hypothetical protein